MKKIFTCFVALLFLLMELSAQKPGGTNSMASITGLYPLGRSIASNCYSPWYNCGNQLWADPLLNELVFLRANDTLGTSGLYYDLSKDGGQTWTIDYGNPYLTAIDPPFYPLVGISNPHGATNPDSAYITYACRASVSGMLQGQQQVSSFIAVNGTDGTLHHTLPSGYMVTKQNIVWNVDAQFIGNTYNDTLIINKGVWNNFTESFDYTNSLLPAPVIWSSNPAYISTSIAFGPDGQTGYIAMGGNNGMLPNAVYYPIIFKTTDGGTTWTGPVAVSLDRIDIALNLGTSIYTLIRPFDITVDGHNELHIACAVYEGFNDWSANANYGHNGLFDIFSSGNQWQARLLSMPETTMGQFGDVWQDSRTQLSMDSSGMKLFYVWAETDTDFFGPNLNIYPDMHLFGYDINSQLCSPEMDLTAGTAGAGLCLFHHVSYYSLLQAFDYVVPIAITVLDAPWMGHSSPASYFYLEGVSVQANSFTLTRPVINLISTATAICSPKPPEHHCVQLIQNSSDGSATLRIDGSIDTYKLAIGITSSEGKEISPSSVAKEKSTVTVSGLNPGIYFYELLSSGQQICRGKFLVR